MLSIARVALLAILAIGSQIATVQAADRKRELISGCVEEAIQTYSTSRQEAEFTFICKGPLAEDLFNDIEHHSRHSQGASRFGLWWVRSFDRFSWCERVLPFGRNRVMYSCKLVIYLGLWR